jgi:HSP20 family protein
MRTSRWQTFSPVWNQLHQLQQEMNRIFDRWGETSGGNWFGFAPSFPAVNVWEDADQVFVEAELPGLKLEDLEISVTGGNQLTLKGERKSAGVDKGVWHRQERATGSFVRMLTLPFPVDAERVDARFENGVLRVQLAKHESAKARKITVKGE